MHARAKYVAAVVGSILAAACAGLFSVEALPEGTGGGGAGGGGAGGSASGGSASGGGGAGDCHQPLPPCLTNASAACLSYRACEANCSCAPVIPEIDCDAPLPGTGSQCNEAETLSQTTEGVILIPLTIVDTCWNCCPPDTIFPATGAPLVARSFDGTLAQLKFPVEDGFRAVGLDLDLRFSSQLGRDALKVVVRTQGDAWMCTATVEVVAEECSQDVRIRFGPEEGQGFIACDPNPDAPLITDALVEISAAAGSSEISASVFKPYVITVPWP